MRLLRMKLTRWKVGRMYFLLYCLFFMANIVLSKSDAEFCSTTCLCLKQSGTVNCSNKALRDLPEDIPIWTKILILDNNRLTSSAISHHDFTKLEFLEELHLNGNKFTTLSLNLSGNPLLSTISASHCSLTSFPDIIGNDNVTMLELSHNAISDLRVTGLTNLKSLDLSFNKIRQIRTEDFINLAQLRHLYLQKNKISAISWEVFAGLVSIESLDLSRNRIREISRDSQPQLPSKQDLCGDVLQTLQHLNLSHNQLGDIQGLTFGGMCALVTLQLDHNQISVLSDGAFYGPKAMKSLILDHNFIGSIAKGWLYWLSSLETLSVAFNNLTLLETDDWSFCKELIHLNVSHNGLPQLKTGDFKTLQKLRTLNLAYNKISQLEDRAFDGLGQLRTLDLSNNEISSSVEDIDGGFLGLDSIEELSLRNNRIRTLSASALEGIDSIVTLDFCGNDVTSIHNRTFDKMANLRTLSIMSSSFLCDCQLAWFPKWLRDMNDSREGFIYNIEGGCFHPPELQGRDILNITEEEFVCVANPMPILLQEPSERTSLKGENVTFECRASAMYTAPQNSTTTPSHIVLHTTTVPNAANAKPGNPLIESPGIPPLQNIDLPETMGDAPESRRNGGFPLKADPQTPPEKREKRKSHKRRNANRPIKGLDVMWKRSGKVIEADSHIGIQQILRQQGGYIYVTSFLVLKGVTSADNGKYNCIVSNNFGHAHSKGAELTVNQFPKFTKIPRNVTVVVNGSSPILQCGATGQPPPQIQWKKDGGKDFPAATERRLLRQQSSAPLLESSDYDEDGDDSDEKGMMLKPNRRGNSDGKNERFMVDTDAPLEFDVVLPKDSGEYECVVESVVGRIVAKAMLIVEIAPSFTKTLPARQKSFVGSSVVFQCPAEGIPEPTISWLFDGRPVNVTSQHFLADDNKMLVVSDIKKDDAGDYSCRAVNEHGEIFHVTTLDVTKDSDGTIFSLLLSGDIATWIVAVCLVVAILTCLMVALLACICYRRRRKEKAMSTNTDETDIEPGHLDSNSCSSDGSVGRGQSSYVMYPIGEGVNHSHEPTAVYVRPEYRASSMSDIAHLRIQSPSAGSNTALLPNGLGAPKRSLSTAAIRKDQDPLSRYRSSESFKVDEQTRYATTCASRTNHPITSPSAAYAKKAAGVENYVPVVLKNRSSTTTTTPTSGSGISSTPATTSEKSDKKKSSKRSKSNMNSTQSNTHEKNGNHTPQRLPNGVGTNLRLTDQTGVSGPRLLNKHNTTQNQKKSNKLNQPHRDRRKMTSPSRHDTTTDSSAPLLHHNGQNSNSHDIPRTVATSVNDKLIT